MYIRKLKLENGKPVLDPTAQAAGIVANFIHSLDAAHLMLTIRSLHEQDEKEFFHFAVIHDGYAVHGCDVDHLHVALREEFVGMYERPLFDRTVLQEFRSDQEASIGKAEISLPPLPAAADPGFDIGLVRASTYFFS